MTGVQTCALPICFPVTICGVTDLNWDRWTVFNGNNPIVQTYWTAEHNIGNGSTNGDHYELGNYNTDGSNLNTYPAVYRGILNFFGDIWTFIEM